MSDCLKVLCSSLNLSPTCYVTAKAIIIKGHLQEKQSIPSKIHLPSYPDNILKDFKLPHSERMGGYPWVLPEAELL